MASAAERSRQSRARKKEKAAKKERRKNQVRVNTQRWRERQTVQPQLPLSTTPHPQQQVSTTPQTTSVTNPRGMSAPQRFQQPPSMIHRSPTNLRGATNSAQPLSQQPLRGSSQPHQQQWQQHQQQVTMMLHGRTSHRGTTNPGSTSTPPPSQQSLRGSSQHQQQEQFGLVPGSEEHARQQQQQFGLVPGSEEHGRRLLFSSATHVVDSSGKEIFQ